VVGFLEGVERRVFDEFSDEITELVGNRHGIYARYRNQHLYYVGLARNLKGRVKHHLRDRHRGKWNYFSMYLVRSEQNLKDLEALAIRIAYPEGNKTRGRFGGAPDLRRLLKRKMTRRAVAEIKNIMGSAGAEPPERESGEKAPFESAVCNFLVKDNAYVLLASRPGRVNFIPESWRKILPENGTAWRHFRVGVCCWLAARPGKLRLGFEVSRMSDPKVRMACVEALRDAGFKLGKAAFREDAKYSRFYRATQEIGDFEDVEEVSGAVEKMLKEASGDFAKAEVVLKKVFGARRSD
jgi:hypothetical protein